MIRRLLSHILFAIIVTMLIILVGCEKYSGDKYEIYYFPFHVNTYGAIDEKRIEEIACYIFEMRSSRIDRLYKEFVGWQNQGALYSYLDFRVKIRRLIRRLIDGKEVYIAKDKTCASDNRIYKIPPEIIRSIAVEITENAENLSARPIYNGDPTCNLDDER